MTLACICYFDNNIMLRTGYGGLLLKMVPLHILPVYTYVRTFMCTSTQQYKTNKTCCYTFARLRGSIRQSTCCYILHQMNEITDMYVSCLLYLKMRNVYQMTLVFSSNGNDGYGHY